MYYGDEIGMHDVPIPPHQVQDPFEKNVPGLGRDPVRTPMQWTGDKWADFSLAPPWLPLADDFKKANVAVERDNGESLLTLYRRLIELRQAEPALAAGDYAALPSGDEVMAYLRKAGERRLLIVLNFSAQPRSFNVAALQARTSLLLSTNLDREHEEFSGEMILRGNEGVIVELS